MENKYLDQYGLNHYHDLTKTEKITATNNTASNQWTGKTDAAGLAVGKTIIMTLPNGSPTGNNYLTLELSDGTKTATIQVVEMTGKPLSREREAGASLMLVYDGARWCNASEEISDKTMLVQHEENSDFELPIHTIDDSKTSTDSTWSSSYISGTFKNSIVTNGSVTSAKLADGAVTTAKLGSTAVTKAKINADVWAEVKNIIYPVGSIYISVNSTSPATLFGGTWTQIKDTFLLAAGTTYTAGKTGGSATTTITYKNLPERTVVSTKNTGSSAVSIGNVPWSATNMSANTWSCVSLADNVNKSDLSPNYGNGTQTAVNTMPPYLAVYVWKRTA